MNITQLHILLCFTVYILLSYSFFMLRYSSILPCYPLYILLSYTSILLRYLSILVCIDSSLFNCPSTVLSVSLFVYILHCIWSNVQLYMSCCVVRLFCAVSGSVAFSVYSALYLVLLRSPSILILYSSNLRVILQLQVILSILLRQKSLLRNCQLCHSSYVSVN